MIGRKASLGIFVAVLAPRALPQNAGIAITKANLKSGRIRLRYESVALDVPRNDGNLLVPRRREGSVFGNPINSDGSWMRPPPPAMESTNPADADARTKKISTGKEIST